MSGSLPLEDVALPGITAAEIVPAISGLSPGQRLIIVGADRHEIMEALRTACGRAALLLAPADARGTGAILQHLLDDLAELAFVRWPIWPAQEEAPGPWMRAASRLAGSGRAPRLRRAEPGIEFDGLRRIVDPGGLVLIAEVDPASPRRARAMIDALEWCTGRGAPTVALLSHRPAGVPPYDRLLYGARELQAVPEPVELRFVASGASPHPASDTEKRVKAALDRDAELAPLFACNQLVSVVEGRQPRVDLLWRDGRVVVELDGPEHQSAPAFASDRHRDYELLVSGYYVLRITNDQVATDLQRAVEKIRAVVRLRVNEGLRP
ncbi:MAG: endonuclease domain-containing protein [Janthinobacterium lividum]